MDANQSVSLSPTQATPQGNITNTPIRAPLSLDSDFESALKTNSNNSSASVSVKSFADEDGDGDGFLSGEDGFETASENHLLHDQDDDALELASAMDEEDDVIVPIVAKPALGSPGVPMAPPKARVSGEEEEDDDHDHDDDGDVVNEVVDSVVRVPLVGEEGGGSDGIDVNGSEKAEGHGLIENGLVSENPVLESAPEKLVEDNVSEPPVEDSETIKNGMESKNPVSGGASADLVEEKAAEAGTVSKEEVLDKNEKVGTSVESPENGVLVSEEKISPLEESSELDSEKLVANGAPAAVEVSTEALVPSEADVLPENPKSNGVVDPENGPQSIPQDDSPELHSGSAELGGDSVPAVSEVAAEALVSSEEDVLPGNLKLGGVVDPEIGGGEKEEVETVEKKEELKTEDEIVEDKKAEEEVGGAKAEVSDEKNSESLSSGNDQANPEDTLLISSQLVEENKEVNEEGVEEVKPNPVEPTSADAQDVEENKTAETKSLELEADSSVNADLASEQPLAVIDEPDDLKAVEMDSDIAKGYEESHKPKASEKNLEHENGEPISSEKNLETVLSTQEPEHEESKVQVPEAQKDDDENNGSSVAKNVSLGSDLISENPEPENEFESGLGNKVSEPMFESAVDADENASGAKLDGLSEDQSADADACVKTEEAYTTQEDTMPAVSTKSIDAAVASETDKLENGIANSSNYSESAGPNSISASEVKKEAEDEVDHLSYDEEVEGSVSDEDHEELNFGSSGTAEQIMKELMSGAGVSFNSGAESSQDGSQRIDGQIVMDSDEEVDTDEEGEGKELFDSAALAALLKAATGAGSEGGNVTVTSQDGSRLFSVERPAGLGSSIRSLKPASQPSRPNIFTSSDLQAGGESESALSEEEKKKLAKLQHIRVKFLRLIHRLGHSPDDAIAAQVLYRMVLAAGRQTGPAFSLETAKKTAMQLEAEKSEDLDFSLNVLVLGKTGVGKSATINSIFGEEKARIGAFEPATTTVKEIIGTVGGVKIRVFDTPGLRSSVMEQAANRRILSSVKKLTKKYPLDILLYVDRLDTQTRDLNDLPLLRTITNTLGSSIWRSAVVTLTHAASAPPDGPSGSPLSYEVFVAQRSHIVQQSIGQAVGDLRMMNPSLMNPVSLVENHPSCRKNRDGQRILPNGQSWRPQLLLLCYSLKVLSEVTSLSKPQDPFDHRKLFGFRVRAPPLPYLLSSLLQSRAHPKLPDDQGGENVDSDIDLEDLEDSEQEEEEDEYDQLPPFKPLRKAQIAKLSKDQKKAYFEEYDYRVKLLQKKQWKEELRRMREMKKKGKGQTDNADFVGEDADQDGPAAVPVPLPDMVLPPSFDGDNPAYRYRFLEPTSQLLARPVLDTHGWDHDCGYDGVSLEENLAIAGRFPGGVAVQITKDKKEFNIHLDSSIAAKHGENGSTLAGFDIQTIGKQLGYIVRGETKFRNFKKNKTTGGISVTFLGENVATGLKVEDQICIGKRLTLVGSTGTIRSQGDMAYGANLEACLKEKDFPIGQDQSTLGLSLMKWRGDLALGANLQSQMSIGRSSKMSVRVGLNNKLSGQITVRTSSSEQLQLALVGILPIAISIYRSIWPSAGESFSAY